MLLDTLPIDIVGLYAYVSSYDDKVNKVRAETINNATYTEQFGEFDHRILMELRKTPSRRFENAKTDVCSVVYNLGSTLLITFRGTKTFVNWKTNLKFKQIDAKSHVSSNNLASENIDIVSLLKQKSLLTPANFTSSNPYQKLVFNETKPYVHSGFLDGYNSVKQNLMEYVIRTKQKNPRLKIVVTGASLGSAFARLFAYDYVKDFGNNNFYIYTAGSPRIGNTEFETTYKLLLGTHATDYINASDLITTLPPKTFGFADITIDKRFKINDISVGGVNDHQSAVYIHILLNQKTKYKAHFNYPELEQAFFSSPSESKESAFSFESKLSTKKRDSLPDSAFGLPKSRAFPLFNKDLKPDTTHIKLAMSMFSKCPPKDRKELAKNILKAAKLAQLDINKESEWYSYTL